MRVMGSNSMKFPGWLGFLLLMAASFAKGALVDISGLEDWHALNNGVYVDATVAYQQSDFNQELMIIESPGGTNGGTAYAGSPPGTPFHFTDIPLVQRDGDWYFHYVMDFQETGGNGRPLQLQSMVLQGVDAFGTLQTIWSMNDDLRFNNGTQQSGTWTDTPLQQGADIAFFVPISLFNAYTFYGSNQFIGTFTTFDQDNGNDEIAVIEGFVLAAEYNVSFLAPDQSFGANSDPPEPQPQDPLAVPEPRTALLMLCASLCLGLWRRYYRSSGYRDPG